MSDDPPPVPATAHPEPVLAYAVAADAGTVRSTNEAFDAAFGAPEPGTPVADVLDAFATVETPGEAAPTAHLVRGDPVALSLDGRHGPHLARVVPGDGGGHLSFTPLDDYPGLVDPAGRLVSAVSHDLRNPLDVAAANLRAARETGDAEHFDAVERAHGRMQALVDDVLALARGAAALDPQDGVSVADAAADAWAAVETGDATLSTAADLPVLRADPDRLRRLLENLFHNAVEHGSPPDREAPVRVRVGTFDGGFYVADDGPGVPPSDRDAVFDAGYAGEGGGTGLGLAIVERVAEAHGWRVALARSRDGGARVEVSVDGD